MKLRLRRILREIDEAVFPSSIYCVDCGALIDRSRVYSLCDECLGKFHWITGRTCEKCGKAMPDTSVGKLCYDCMQEEHFFRKGFSCLTYGLHERELMMDLKYAGKGYLARLFGDMMFDRMEVEITDGLFAPPEAAPAGDAPVICEREHEKNELDEWERGADLHSVTECGSDQHGAPERDVDLHGTPEHVRIDLIVPVPVSDGRYRKRGYNQSAIMARQLASRWRDFVEEAAERPADGEVEDGECFFTPSAAVEGSSGAARLYPAPVCRSNLLYRTRETVMLRSLNPTERRMALQEAFAVREPEKEKVAGRNVLLVDDIYTTGATADACAQALLKGGAKDVYLLTLASGGNRRPEDDR